MAAGKKKEKDARNEKEKGNRKEKDRSKKQKTKRQIKKERPDGAKQVSIPKKKSAMAICS